MFGLCQYSDIFGRPRQGLHQFHLFGVALFDLGLTIIATGILSWFFGFSLLWTFITLFFVGQLFHILMCVNTSFVNNVLGMTFDNDVNLKS